MLEDMILAGHATKTRKRYIEQIEKLVKYYGIAPDRLTEQQVRDYFLYLREEKQVARGTFEVALAAIRFFFYVTLDRDWPLFSKKRSLCHFRSVCPTHGRTKRSACCSARFVSPSTARACARCTRAACA